MDRAVIFDMDGVLLDSEPMHFDCARRLFAEDGLDYTHEINSEFIGYTATHVMDVLIARYKLPRSSAQYMEAYDRAIIERMRRHGEPSDGVGWLLDELARRGVAIGLASNSSASWVAATLGGLGLADRFGAAVAGDMVARGKPAPDVYLEAARRLGVAPGRCVAIEDSGTGLTAALAAGMTALALQTPHVEPARLAHAHRILQSLREFPLELLERA